MKWGPVWLLVGALGCGRNEVSPAGDQTGGASGTGGGTGAAGSSGTSSECALTFEGQSEPRFEQPASRVRVFAGSYFTVVEAAFLDGPRPELHTEAERSGDCRMLTYDSPSFCDPACENPEICIGGACERFPEPVSAGALSVELGADQKVEVPPSNVGRYYWGTEDFGYDVVPSVNVSAPGEVAPGFELAACLSPAPQPTTEWNELLEQRAPGEDVVLAWSNPVETARVYLRMTTCIGTHGGISPVEIECEGKDVGKLTLPGVFLDALYEQGWGRGECGTNDVWRYHATELGSGDAAVQLRAESGASFYFQPRLGGP